MPAAIPEQDPDEVERTAPLKDGSRVRIRPVRAEDAGRLSEFYRHLSQQTTFQRFFTAMKRLPPVWARILAAVDYRRRLALIAEHEGPAGWELIGLGRYEPADRKDTAEVAFVVQDTRRGGNRERRRVMSETRRVTAEYIREMAAIHGVPLDPASVERRVRDIELNLSKLDRVRLEELQGVPPAFLQAQSHPKPSRPERHRQ